METEKRKEESPPDGSMETGSRQRRVRIRRTVIFLVVCLVNIGFLGVLTSQLLTVAQNQSVPTLAGIRVKSPLEGHPAPDFTLPRLSERPASSLRLADLKGHPVLLNFWASWCDACKREAPVMKATWRRVQGQGVVFVGIDVQDTRSAGLDFLHQYDITYPNVVDATGAVSIEYGMTGVPETFFLDRRGVVVRKVIGELTEPILQSNLRLLGAAL
jgi:cytochrome c biogenesis protein CcmG/thiol:disulfide interchange protein DsbE